jgi:hypothetical protein
VLELTPFRLPGGHQNAVFDGMLDAKCKGAGSCQESRIFGSSVVECLADSCELSTHAGISTTTCRDQSCDATNGEHKVDGDAIVVCIGPDACKVLQLRSVVCTIYP